MVRILFKRAFLIFGLFFLAFGSAEAAYLYFSPSVGTYGKGENFTVGISVNAEKPINAVRGVLNFPTEYLEAVALSTVNSIVNLWVQNPSFSNAGSAGNVRFEGVVLNPGFTGSSGRVADVVFRVKKSGSVALNFGETAVLANDGKGTNIGTAPGSASFTLTELSTGATREKSELEKRIEGVEEQVKAITETPPAQPTIIVQGPAQPNGVIGFWYLLPRWVQFGVLLFIGVATLILLLAFISFLAIILIWFWSYLWHNRMRFRWRLTIAWENLKYFFGVVKREVEGDVAYGIHELQDEIKSAKEVPSLKTLLADYWRAIGRIIKRFFTKNESDASEDEGQDKV